MRFRRPPTSIAVIAVLSRHPHDGCRACRRLPTRARPREAPRVREPLPRRSRAPSAPREPRRRPHRATARDLDEELAHALPQLEHVDEAARTTSEMLGREHRDGTVRVEGLQGVGPQQRAPREHARTPTIDRRASACPTPTGTYWITMIYFGWAGLDRSRSGVVRCVRGRHRNEPADRTDAARRHVVRRHRTRLRPDGHVLVVRAGRPVAPLPRLSDRAHAAARARRRDRHGSCGP